jgi:hypothetical protein
MQTPWQTPGNPELANTVHQWLPSDTEANYHHRKHSHSLYGPDSFDYRYNELGWRCDSMLSPRSHRHRVIWAGCSVTEGIGLPMQATWGADLTDRLRAELASPSMPYWCVARGGVSQDYLARQLSMMVPKLRPQVVVALLPDIARRELHMPQGLINWTPGDSTNQALTESLLQIWSDDQILHDAHKNIVFMHSICAAHGCDFWWHTAMYTHQDCYAQLLQGLPQSLRDCHFDSAPGGGDLARDELHGGPQTHADFAAALWTEIGPKIVGKCHG